MKILNLAWSSEKNSIEEEIAEKFQIYSGYYKEREEKSPLICLFGRDNKNSRLLLLVSNFYPYFYVNNGKAKKVVSKPAQVKELRAKYKRSWEADIPFVRRFLVDADLSMHYVYPKILYLDLEVDLPNSEEILSMSYKVGDSSILTALGEKEVERTLQQLIKEGQFDGFAAWYSPFDMKYLRKRIRKIKNWKNFFEFDVYNRFLGYWHDKEGLPNYTLDTVGQYLLGKGKLYPEIRNNLGSLSENDLVAYNQRDVELLYEIDQKLNLSRTHSYIAYLNKALIEDSYSSLNIGDIAILRAAKKRGIILPSAYEKRRVQDYQGSFVYAKLGLYSNICIFDIHSAYPSAIMQRNISFENANIKNGIVSFPKKPVGILPEIILRWLSQRKQSKKGSPENEAFKKLSNSTYGLLGAPVSRIYDPQIAEEVTKTIKGILEGLKIYLEEESFNLIYADTDSVFLSDIKSKKEITKIEELMQKFISQQLEFEKIRIGFEDFFEEGCIISKKQYYLRTQNRTKERGLPLRRGDTSSYLKEKYKKVLDLIFEGKPHIDIFRGIEAEVKREIRNVPLEQIVTPKGYTVSKGYKVNTQQKKAYEYSKKYFGLQLDFGEKLKILPIKSTPSDFSTTDVLALPSNPELIKNFEIDYERITENIMNRIKLLFSFEENFHDQKTILDFDNR